jgi:hypothetical protein
MSADDSNEVLMKSLAQCVTHGENVSNWARSSDVAADVAQGWIEMPEFREMIGKCRIEHAEQMVGKIGKCAERAIDRLVEYSENTRDLGVGLGATKALIDKWIGLSVFFVQEQKYENLLTNAQRLAAGKKAEKLAARMGYSR